MGVGEVGGGAQPHHELIPLKAANRVVILGLLNQR